MSRKKRRAASAPDPADPILSLTSGPTPPGAWLWFLLWAGVILFFYYQHVKAPFLNPSFWFRFFPPIMKMSPALAAAHGVRIAQIVCWWALCAGVGRGLLLKIFRAKGLNALETGSIGFALGVGVVGLGSLAIGFAGLLTPWPVRIFAAGLTAWALWANADFLSESASLRPRDCWPDPWSKIAGGFVGFLLAFQLFHALAPDIFYDSLVYHLALPHLYRLEGGLVATPTNLYSGLPMLVQWNYAFLLFFADEITAKLVQWGCGAAIAMGFVGLGLRLKRPSVGWTAGIVFLGTPMVLYNIVRAGVDVGSALMIFAAVYAGTLSFKDEGASLLPVSAALCGLALGVKYPNWPLLPALLLVFAALKVPREKIFRYGAIALLVLSPWVMKNLWLYGNPLFPYFHDFIQPGAEFESPWRVLHASGWGREWGVLLRSPGKLWVALAHPWYSTVTGTTEFDHIGPFYLMALLPLVWFRPAGKSTRFWLWTLFGLWMLWWPLTRMPRFFMPGFCVLSVVVSLVFNAPKSVWAARALRAGLLLLTLDGVVMYLAITNQSDAYSYLIGGVSKDEYLGETRKTYPASYYRAARWIDENTPADARLLLVGGGRGFYMPRPFLASTDYDVDRFSRWLLQAKSAEAFYAKLRSEGITHLVVNLAWLWRGDPKEAATPERAALLEEFGDRHIRLAFSDVQQTPSRWVHVYELLEKAGKRPQGFESFVKWYRSGGRSGMGY